MKKKYIKPAIVLFQLQAPYLDTVVNTSINTIGGDVDDLYFGEDAVYGMEGE